MDKSVSGTFELNRASGGFLRRAEASYQTRPDDVQLKPELCRRFGLRGGETIVGFLENNSKRGRRSGSPQLKEVESINDLPADQYLESKPLEELTPIDPDKPIRLETPDGPVTMRIIDLLTPIGFGQRGLIVAPPRTGKTVLLQQMAHAVATNHPDVYLMVLLIDERPEEVTDMRRNVRGEVIASCNDHDATRHTRTARLMIEKAKRMVECGRDVLVLLDSITRVGRAFNNVIRGSGRIMSGGLDSSALVEPKAIFGAARNIEGGGSLTIIASALIETGSRMDDVIFNEFKGTGNMEIMLSRELANRRLWPAIDLNQSGTRKEERLLSPQALAVSHDIRRALYDKEPIQAMETLLEAMGKHADNAGFLKQYDRR